MKRAVLLTLLAALIVAAGCTGGTGPSATRRPAATATPRPTQAPTDAPTDVPAESPTQAPADESALPEGITVIDPPQAMTDFTLTNHKGEAMKLSDLRGKTLVVSFGYTNCPDVCPITLAQFGRVRSLLGDDAEKVQFVFISVDGTRDTPERLAGYLPVFNADILGLMGDDDAVRAVISEYGGDYTLNNAGGLRENYTVDHTASKFLLDEEGRWQRTYGYNLAPDVIAADIKTLLSN